MVPTPTIMEKCLLTICISGPSLESQMTNLSPLPTNKVGCVNITLL